MKFAISIRSALIVLLAAMIATGSYVASAQPSIHPGHKAPPTTEVTPTQVGPKATVSPLKAPDLPTPQPTMIPGPTKGGDSYVVAGTMRLYGSDGDEFDLYGPKSKSLDTHNTTWCLGQGGYSDIAPGAQVTVRDQSGEVIALAQLEPHPGDTTPACLFTFSVEVPEAKFYSFEVSHRGQVSFSKKDLAEGNWSIELALGN